MNRKAYASGGTTGCATAAEVRSRKGYRRALLGLATAATIFSLLHHADHVMRGSHSGWPFEAEVTPFTFSLVIYLLILPGIYLTARGRSIAGYHLFVAAGGLAMLGFVHFVPVEGHEAPISDIYAAYASPAAGILALTILAGLLTSVALLALVALIAGREAARVPGSGEPGGSSEGRGFLGTALLARVTGSGRKPTARAAAPPPDGL